MTTTTPKTEPAFRYGSCLLFAANALARVVTAIADSEFAKIGLSYSHAFLLNEVILQPGQTPTALSETLLLSPSTITRLVEKLEQKGLVHRQTEGRRTRVYATSQGAALAEDLQAATAQNRTKFADQLGEQEVAHLTQLVFAAARQLTYL